MPHLRRTATLAAAVLTTLALTATPAFAGKQTGKDPAKDVRKVTSGQITKVPRNKSIDIVKVGATHANQKVVLSTEVRALGRGSYTFRWEVRNAGDGHWLVEFVKVPGSATSTLSVWNGGESGCAVEHRFSRRTDRVRVSFPRFCLGNPQWIRFGALTTKPVTGAVLVDIARVKGGVAGAPSTVLGKRVHYN